MIINKYDLYISFALCPVKPSWCSYWKTLFKTTLAVGPQEETLAESATITSPQLLLLPVTLLSFQ